MVSTANFSCDVRCVFSISHSSLCTRPSLTVRSSRRLINVQGASIKVYTSAHTCAYKCFVRARSRTRIICCAQNVSQLLGPQGRGQRFLIFVILANEERRFGSISCTARRFCSAEHSSYRPPTAEEGLRTVRQAASLFQVHSVADARARISRRSRTFVWTFAFAYEMKRTIRSIYYYEDTKAPRSHKRGRL